MEKVGDRDTEIQRVKRKERVEYGRGRYKDR